MPIATIDYRQPMPFVSRGLASWSSHSALLDVHRASPCLMAPKPTAVNNLAVHRIMERMGYNAGHGHGLHHRYSGLGTDHAAASYIIPTANNPFNDSTSSDDEGASNLSPHDDEIRQPLSPQESHTKVILDMVISEFTKLLTEYPSYYKELSLPNTARKMLVPIV